jgi:hypothetical protein
MIEFLDLQPRPGHADACIPAVDATAQLMSDWRRGATDLGLGCALRRVTCCLLGFLYFPNSFSALFVPQSIFFSGRSLRARLASVRLCSFANRFVLPNIEQERRQLFFSQDDAFLGPHDVIFRSALHQFPREIMLVANVAVRSSVSRGNGCAM